MRLVQVDKVRSKRILAEVAVHASVEQVLSFSGCFACSLQCDSKLMCRGLLHATIGRAWRRLYCAGSMTAA